MEGRALGLKFRGDWQQYCVDQVMRIQLAEWGVCACCEKRIPSSS